jgi:hypothetical protein
METFGPLAFANRFHYEKSGLRPLNSLVANDPRGDQIYVFGKPISIIPS